MDIILTLILFPLVIALLTFLIRQNLIRNIIVFIASVVIFLASIYLLIFHFPKEGVFFKLDFPLIEKIILGLEIVISLFIIFISIKYKKFLVTLITLLQAGLIIFFDLYYGHNIHVENNLFIDKLSIIMALVIGVVGSFITLYSIGYMNDFHKDHRSEIKDNRSFFFFVVFLFFSAMFGIVFSNNLMWIYFFWEITTLCSFFLISYKKTEEAYNNAFRALFYNLIGGLSFAIGIVYLYMTEKTIELDKLLLLGKAHVLLPAILIGIAGISKSAQLPFSKWLLGAMVAPTPVSALLHSSTMVKAGVYILLRLSTVYQSTTAGFILAIIGATTFVITSFIAIAASDAKRVLALSTIANLGLIVICAGVGTYEAVWAGILLIIFHAVSKCLLFLCVGVVEHKLHSRDIEDMSGLIVSMPKTSIFVQIGIAGMFLAPFGMLISKWAVLKALVDFNPIMTIFIVFGSAATLFFWVKWLGKILIVINPVKNLEEGISKTIWVPLGALAALTVMLCMAFPLVSSFLIEPYLINVYGHVTRMASGNLIIMLILLGMVSLFPLSFLNYGKKVKVVDPYLGGANSDNIINFTSSLGKSVDMQLKNYYFANFLNNKYIFIFGVIMNIILILGMISVSL